MVQHATLSHIPAQISPTALTQLELYHPQLVFKKAIAQKACVQVQEHRCIIAPLHHAAHAYAPHRVHLFAGWSLQGGVRILSDASHCKYCGHSDQGMTDGVLFNLQDLDMDRWRLPPGTVIIKMHQQRVWGN